MWRRAELPVAPRLDAGWALRFAVPQFRRDVDDQLPVDPPRCRHVARDGPAEPTDCWGPRATQVLIEARRVVVETAPLALLVCSTGASAVNVGRVALALAKAVVEDAAGTHQA